VGGGGGPPRWKDGWDEWVDGWMGG
jgi:hypothetical protein